MHENLEEIDWKLTLVTLISIAFIALIVYSYIDSFAISVERMKALLQAPFVDKPQTNFTV